MKTDAAAHFWYCAVCTRVSNRTSKEKWKIVPKSGSRILTNVLINFLSGNPYLLWFQHPTLFTFFRRTHFLVDPLKHVLLPSFVFSIPFAELSSLCVCVRVCGFDFSFLVRFLFTPSVCTPLVSTYRHANQIWNMSTSAARPHNEQQWTRDREKERGNANEREIETGIHQFHACSMLLKSVRYGNRDIWMCDCLCACVCVAWQLNTVRACVCFRHGFFPTFVFVCLINAIT